MTRKDVKKRWQEKMTRKDDKKRGQEKMTSYIITQKWTTYRDTEYLKKNTCNTHTHKKYPSEVTELLTLQKKLW